MLKEAQPAHFLFENCRFFIGALLVGALIGGGVTFLMPKKYRSIAVVYPYNTHTKNDIISNPQFGYEVETEQLLQLLESASMRDRTIEKFRLYEYYQLDTNRRDWRTRLMMEYLNDVSFSRSRYLSVVISVTTKDPELSARIANFQVSEVDKYRASIFEENRKRELLNKEREYQQSEEAMGRLRDSIYGIKTNKQELLYTFIENLNNENYRADEFVDDPALEKLVDQYIFLFRRNAELRRSYFEASERMQEPLPSVYVIDKASPSYKKVSPSLILNTLVGAALAFGLMVVGKLSFEKWKQLRRE